MITQETKQEVYNRDKGECQGCKRTTELERTPHHCFFRSKYYGSNRDEAWNLVIICIYCHDSVHHKGNKNLRYYLEELALERKNEDS